MNLGLAAHALQKCIWYQDAEMRARLGSLSTQINAMATLTALKKKIAALEAQVELVSKAELGNAIAKIRKIMSDYGVTLEHLAAKTKDVKTKSKGNAGGKTADVSKRPAKYRDPESGATWSGLGRVPAWIAGAEDRNEFLIRGAGVGKFAAKKKPAGTARKAKSVAEATPAARRPSKRAAAKKAISGKKAVSAKAKQPTAKASVSTKRAKRQAVGTSKPAVRKGRQAPKAIVGSATAPAAESASEASAS